MSLKNNIKVHLFMNYKQLCCGKCCTLCSSSCGVFNIVLGIVIHVLMNCQKLYKA